MISTLNPRQLVFAQNVAAGMSLTAAYREAGYSGEGHVAHVGASKLMKKNAVADFVEARRNEQTLNTVADRTEILVRLTGVLRSEAADLDSLPVHEVTRRTVLKSDGSCSTVVRSKSMSRHAAIRQLARMLGLGGKPRPEDFAARDRHRSALEARATVATAIGENDGASHLPEITGDPHCILRVGRHLNSRQRLFCEYLARDFSAYQAYGFAGYRIARDDPDHAASAASRLLKRPGVIAYLRELRRFTALQDLAGEVAGHDETLAYLTQALRATRAEIETQGRFVDQVVRDEIKKPDGDTEIRVAVRSVSQPRIIAQLASLLGPAAKPGDCLEIRQEEDRYLAEIRAELEDLFADDGVETQPSLSRKSA